MWKQGDENTISTSKEPLSFPWPNIIFYNNQRIGSELEHAPESPHPVVACEIRTITVPDRQETGCR